MCMNENLNDNAILMHYTSVVDSSTPNETGSDGSEKNLRLPSPSALYAAHPNKHVLPHLFFVGQLRDSMGIHHRAATVT